MCKSALAAAVALAVTSKSDASATYFASGNDYAPAGSTVYTIQGLGVAPVAVPLGPSGVELFDLAVSPSTGTLFGIGSPLGGGGAKLYSIHHGTGVATQIGNGLSDTLFLNALIGLPDGRLITWDGSNPDLFEVSLDGNGLTPIPIANLDVSSMGDLAYDPSTGDLFGMGRAVGGTSLIRIDLFAQTAVVIAEYPGFSYAGAAIDPVSGILYAAQEAPGPSVQVSRIDTTTGVVIDTVSVLNAEAYGLGGLAVIPAPGPSIALGGLCALALRRHRRDESDLTQSSRRSL